MWRSAGRARVCPCAATVRDHSLRAYVRMMVPADGKLVNAHPTSVLRPTFIALRCVPAGPILTFRPDALHLSNALFAPMRRADAMNAANNRDLTDVKMVQPRAHDVIEIQRARVNGRWINVTPSVQI